MAALTAGAFRTLVRRSGRGAFRRPKLGGTAVSYTHLDVYKRQLDQVLNGMAQDQFLVGGKISDVVRKEAECRGLVISDYLLREELAVMNAVPTAEGAVSYTHLPGGRGGGPS